MKTATIELNHKQLSILYDSITNKLECNPKSKETKDLWSIIYKAYQETNPYNV
jgi:hypothetical protein